MKLHFFKRICILVAALMALALLPVSTLADPSPAFSIGSDSYATLPDAIDAAAALPNTADNPVVIKVNYDHSHAGCILITNTHIRFDLQGHAFGIETGSDYALTVSATDGNSCSVGYVDDIGGGSFQVVGHNNGLGLSVNVDGTGSATASVTSASADNGGIDGVVRVVSDVGGTASVTVE